MSTMSNLIEMSPAAAQPPPEVIETERLVFRSPSPGDASEVNAAIQETFNELRAWFDWARRLPADREIEEYIRRSRDSFAAHADFVYGAFLKGSGRFVMVAGLHPKDWAVPKIEIGYWCRLLFQGHGYVTEAVKALTRVGFEVMKANKMEIRCDSGNERSLRVAERAGYNLEARLRSDKLRPNGDLRDTLVYSLLPQEYILLQGHCHSDVQPRE